MCCVRGAQEGVTLHVVCIACHCPHLSGAGAPASWAAATAALTTRLRSLLSGSSSCPSRKAALNRDDQGTRNGAPPPPPPPPPMALAVRARACHTATASRASGRASLRAWQPRLKARCVPLFAFSVLSTLGCIRRDSSASPEPLASHGAVLDGRHSTGVDTAAQCRTASARRQVQGSLPAAVAQAAGQLRGCAGRAGAGHRRVAVPNSCWLRAAHGCAPACLCLSFLAALVHTLTASCVPCGAGNGGDALATLRRTGAASLAAARTPTTRDEAYRFTDLSALTQVRHQPPGRQLVALVVSPAAPSTKCLHDAHFLLLTTRPGWWRHQPASRWT